MRKEEVLTQQFAKETKVVLVRNTQIRTNINSKNIEENTIGLTTIVSFPLAVGTSSAVVAVGTVCLQLHRTRGHVRQEALLIFIVTAGRLSEVKNGH